MLEATTSKTCKFPLVVDYNMIDTWPQKKQVATHYRLQPNWGSNPLEDPTSMKESTSFFNFLLDLYFISFSNWIQCHHISLNLLSKGLSQTVITTSSLYHCKIVTLLDITYYHGTSTQPATIILQKNHINHCQWLSYHFPYFVSTNSSIWSFKPLLRTCLHHISKTTTTFS